jgi:predicted short-subunit dehydrogenase-like oxidoreductase (DUF2520 family)
MTMGKAISGDVRKISSTERQALHVAAVFASNFSNHMLTLAKDVLQKNNLNFDLLRPLITETFNKSLANGPDRSQTGPAMRGDLEILDRHIEFLKDDKTMAEIYKIVSQDILDRYDPE